jgi:hypothetical protein
MRGVSRVYGRLAVEDDGTSMVAAWYDPRELDMDGSPELYPMGLKTRLLGR